MRSGTVLITGASRGIGRATALKFAENGYNVLIQYLNSKQAAESLCDEIAALGADASTFCADVSDSEQVKALVGETQNRFGHIDVLINNAGIAQSKLFTDITDEDWDRMMSVNVRSMFYTCRAVLPEMIRRKSGTIVNISSMWGQVGGSCEVHYSAAKAAVIGLTKALAKEVALSGIRVNCVAPGIIQTDMLSGFTADDLEAMRDETPLQRLGQAQDVARAVYFLASEESSFITGQVLAPNGGIVI